MGTAHNIAPALLSPTASLAQARRLRVWTDRDNASLRHQFARLVGEWNADWGVSSETPSAVCITSPDVNRGDYDWQLATTTALASPDAGIWWTYTPGDSRRQAVADLAASARLALQTALFGPAPIPMTDAPSAAEDVLRQAWDNWWTRLEQLLGETLTPVGNVGALAPRTGFWSGTLQVEFVWCTGKFFLCLGTTQVENLLTVVETAQNAAPPNPVTPPVRAPLGQALSGLPFRVRAELGEVELSLGQLQDLHVGDVIALHHPLNAPALVNDLDGQILCRGWLGQVNGQLAVELATPGK